MKFWKKVLASVTAGVLCLGGVGLSGVESVLEDGVISECDRTIFLRWQHI